MKVGFLVNPIAGMGGKVGLKGTDGYQTLKKAQKLGAKQEALIKAEFALNEISDKKDSIEFITGRGDLGETLLKKHGFKYKAFLDKEKETDRLDTIKLAKIFLDEDVDIILFAGGDGTARDIYQVIGDKKPVIGIPAGVKIHSAIFSNSPSLSGKLLYNYMTSDIELKLKEVMDIDEELFRQDRLDAKLFGYMKVPYKEEFIQNQKSSVLETEAAAIDGITDRIIDDMEEDVYYLIGSGTTTKPIMDKLGLNNTLLGIDIIKNKKLVLNDANERDILEIIKGKKAKIVVTIIGGQGYIFGRGNQQLSKDVVKLVGKDNIKIIASKRKLMDLKDKDLLVDLFDKDLNKRFNGYSLIRTSYSEETVHRTKGL